jgi:hypothetical protein
MEPPECDGADDGGVSPARLYDAVRTHEVMLNEAASAFEHAVIARLTLLNGGAATAFLTLLGAISKTDSQLRADSAWAGAAIIAWIVGLAAAAFATSCRFRVQRAINQGYRLMREQLELELFSARIANIVKPPRDPKQVPKTREDFSAERELYAGRYEKLWWASVICFLLGVGAATVAVL